MKKKLVLLLLAALFSASVLSGCASVYSPETEDMSNTRELGEAVEVDIQYNFLFLYDRGPYSFRITPEEIVNLAVDGEPVDCVKVKYEVLATHDGKPAEYATSTLAINLLSEDLNEVEFSVWLSDEDGTRVDIRNFELEVGETYEFYIPLQSSLLGYNRELYYITVSDRTDFYSRSGTTYWYKVPQALF